MKVKTTVAEALRRIDAGESVNGIMIDFEKIKIESLDVMKLAKHGIAVPEESIYYDEDDILIDEDELEGKLVRIENDPADIILSSVVKINLDDEVKEWISEKNIELDRLAESLINGFYQSHKALVERS